MQLFPAKLRLGAKFERFYFGRERPGLNEPASFVIFWAIGGEVMFAVPISLF